MTFPKADALREVAATVPADRLLVETDGPYLAPVPHRGKRNEPALVVHVAEALASAAADDAPPAIVAADRRAISRRCSAPEARTRGVARLQPGRDGALTPLLNLWSD